jgi:hypothetical protein
MMSRKRRIVMVGAAASVAVATLLALVLVPVPQHFSMHGVAIYDLQTACTGIDASQGTTVYFHWSAAGWTDFFVLSCSANQVVFAGNGTQGSGTFVSTGGVYEFGSACPGPEPCYPADVSGTYTGPLLPL